MEQDKDANGKQVIARAAAVLRALEGHADGLTLAALTRAADLPRTTTQRIVAALQGQQFVTAIDGRILLGPAITRLAGSNYLDVVGIVRPHIETLGRKTHETVNLSVLRGNHAVIVDQVASDRELRVVTPVGSALPLYCTAHGKALLASMDDAEILQRLAGRWERRTERTVTRQADLLDRLPGIRAAGLADDQGEHLLGVCGIGVALQTKTPERYALSVTVPEVRFSTERPQLEEALRACAMAVTACFS